MQQWLLIGAGVLLLLQQMKIVDLSKVPILGQILVALKLTPPGEAVAGTVSAKPPANGTGTVDRYDTLLSSMREIRHFLSEQTGDARKLLDSCDQFDKVINEAKAKNATPK